MSAPTTSAKRRLAGWAAAGALFLVPLLVMQFTAEIQWDSADFAMFGAMILAAGLALELSLRILHARKARLLVITFIAAAFLMIWADAAVGL